MQVVILEGGITCIQVQDKKMPIREDCRVYEEYLERLRKWQNRKLKTFNISNPDKWIVGQEYYSKKIDNKTVIIFKRKPRAIWKVPTNGLAGYEPSWGDING